MGIIGGADGPTAIFVSGNLPGLILVLLAAMAIIGGGIWFFLHKRKK